MVYNLFMTSHWTKEQYQEFLRRTQSEDSESAQLLKKLGVETISKKSKTTKIKKNKVDPLLALIDPEEAAKLQSEVIKKRRAQESAPILQSLRHCLPKVKVEKGELPILSIWMDGARVFTINDIFQILQYRKYEIMNYKKAWKSLIHRSILLIPIQDRPHFKGPVRIELVRRGKKRLDDDATRIVFKHAIDALVKEKILLDDNPNVVVETKAWDYQGKIGLGIRLVALAEYPKKEEINPEKDWF